MKAAPSLLLILLFTTLAVAEKKPVADAKVAATANNAFAADLYGALNPILFNSPTLVRLTVDKRSDKT